MMLDKYERGNLWDVNTHQFFINELKQKIFTFLLSLKHYSKKNNFRFPKPLSFVLIRMITDFYMKGLAKKNLRKRNEEKNEKEKSNLDEEMNNDLSDEKNEKRKRGGKRNNALSQKKNEKKKKRNWKRRYSDIELRKKTIVLLISNSTFRFEIK